MGGHRSLAAAPDCASAIVCLFALAVMAPAAVLGCFDGCDCIRDKLSCRETTLPAIPATTVSYPAIEFKNNLFKSHSLGRSNFSGFTGSVTKLSIVGCGIERIEPLAFSELRKLTWLDLSDNNIGEIDPYAFASVTVGHLFLNKNPRLSLVGKSFEGLNTSGLYLSQCGLRDTLTAEAVRPLQRWLRTLWLDGNGIRTLDGGLAEMLSGLDTLRLGDNPLDCDCRLLWLRQNARFLTMVGSGEATVAQPLCASPHWLAGQPLAGVGVAELRCLPGNLELSLTVSGDGRAVALCSASAAPSASHSLVFSRRGDDGREDAVPGRTDDVAAGRIVASLRVAQAAGLYRCTSTGGSSNVSVTFNFTYPTLVQQQQQSGGAVLDAGVQAPPGSTLPPLAAASARLQPQQQQPSATLCPVPAVPDPAQAKGGGGGGTTAADTALTTASAGAGPTVASVGDPFMTKYFTLVDLLGTAFGTFAGTLVTCVLVMHFCVYRVRQASPRYEPSSAQSSDYGAGSVKSYLPPPSTAGRTMPTPTSTVPSLGLSSCDRRLLPPPPPPLYKHQNPVFDENHYMTTNLEEMEFLNGCQHQPCAACQQSMMQAA